MSVGRPPQTADTLQPLLRKGFRALERGDHAAATECCQKLLTQQPDLPQAHFLVGMLGLEMKDRATAFKAFLSTVKLDPDHAAAWAQLARLYLSEGQIRRADAALRETLRIKPEEPMVLDLIGTVLTRMGEHGAAQAFFQRANSKLPNTPPLMQNLANNLVHHGDTHRARRIFDDIIRLQPDSPQAHWALASASTATDENHIEHMRHCIDQRGDDPKANAFYYYAIGKEHEDLQQWPKAFEAFARGARARRRTIEYDEEAEAAMFDSLQQHYTEQWLCGSSEGLPDSSAIFVLGQPRTGTTLVERIITSHSRVHSAGELQQFGLALRRLTGHSNPQRFSADLFAKAALLTPEKIASLYLDSTRKLRGRAPFFVDKLPQNYLMIPLILKALPNAKIVHLVRDPMDACFASFKQLFADAYLHSYDQEEMARHHARYFQLMQLWRERFPGRFMDVSYEATASQPEASARDIINFLGLPWEDACLQFHQQGAAVTTASAVQVRQPAHTRSIGRWRRYVEQLQPMLGALEKAGVPVK